MKYYSKDTWKLTHYLLGSGWFQTQPRPDNTGTGHHTKFYDRTNFRSDVFGCRFRPISSWGSTWPDIVYTTDGYQDGVWPLRLGLSGQVRRAFWPSAPPPSTGQRDLHQWQEDGDSGHLLEPDPGAEAEPADPLHRPARGAGRARVGEVRPRGTKKKKKESIDRNAVAFFSFRFLNRPRHRRPLQAVAARDPGHQQQGPDGGHQREVHPGGGSEEVCPRAQGQVRGVDPGALRAGPRHRRVALQIRRVSGRPPSNMAIKIW